MLSLKFLCASTSHCLTERSCRVRSPAPSFWSNQPIACPFLAILGCYCADARPTSASDTDTLRAASTFQPLESRSLPLHSAPVYPCTTWPYISSNPSRLDVCDSYTSCLFVRLNYRPHLHQRSQIITGSGSAHDNRNQPSISVSEREGRGCPPHRQSPWSYRLETSTMIPEDGSCAS